jgi:hypothetical protein
VVEFFSFRGEIEMAKPNQPDQASDPTEMTLDELDNIAAGHGVVPPPPGFDNLETKAPPPKPIGNKII